MARRKKTDDEKKEAILRANSWRSFMQSYLITEKTLADLLGVSRRTVQMIRAGAVIPSKETLKKWDILKAKHESGNTV